MKGKQVGQVNRCAKWTFLNLEISLKDQHDNKHATDTNCANHAGKEREKGDSMM